MQTAMHLPNNPSTLVSAHTELGTLCGGYLLVLIYVTKLHTISHNGFTNQYTTGALVATVVLATTLVLSRN